MNDECIMPECPYCPSCPYGYIYQNEDWEEDRTEWICTYNGEMKNETD